MMNYCMECGHKLEMRSLENEGMIPYCPSCGQFRFPVFNTAVIMIVVDTDAQKILLIKQYNRPDYILVAGYVNRGESAEHAVAREIMEEVGLQVDKVQFNQSRFFERSNSLMLNFTAFIHGGERLHSNQEVDAWHWFTFEEARRNIKPGSLAKDFLCDYLDSLS